MKKYPDGKIDENDEGVLRIAMFVKDNRVVIDFGKKISWFGFDKATLKTFIESLEDKLHTL